MDREDEREFEKLKRDKEKADRKENLKEVAQICNCMGELLAKYGRWEEAKKEHETELSISEALCDTIGCAIACRKIGECFCGLELYQKALNFQQRHLALAKSSDNLLEEQRALATIGRTYLIQTDAAKSQNTMLQLSRKAEEAFKKSLDVCEKLREEVKPVEYMEMKARLYLNLGLVYDGQGKHTQCAEFMKKAISIAGQHKLYSDLYRCQYSLASMYQKAGNLSQALRNLEAAHKSAVKLKDKYLESEVLTQKSLISLQLGDYSTCKHVLKKAHKLGSTTEDEAERIRKCFKAASKMEEASQSLETMTESASDTRMKLFETLGDCSADAGNYKPALEYYNKMLECALELNKSGKELTPIYVSLAQTYSDDKQYKNAIENYKKEIELRGENHEQICRTLLNIAEIEELDGQGYTVISQAYLSAFDHAKKAKLPKLQVYVLKSFIEVQKHFRRSDHQEQTQSKLDTIKTKHNVDSDDELLDDDRDSQRVDENEDDDEDDNCSISELSESDESEEDTARVQVSLAGRARRTVQAKRNEKGETPLHRACIEGNLKKVKKLIEQGHQVNPRDYCGWIPLHEAANHGFCDIVEYLIDHGAAINDRGGVHCAGVTPLIDAANCGNLDVIELLISKGANVIAKDDEGNNALDCLHAWRRRCEDLGGEDLQQYERLVNKLSVQNPAGGSSRMLESMDSVFTQNSQTRSTRVSQKRLSEDGDTLPTMKKSGQHKARSRSLRCTLSSDSESDKEESSSLYPDSFVPDSEDIYENPHLREDQASTSATDSYRTAIKSVGLSANRRDREKCDVPSSQVNRKERDPGAFVEESEFIDDDWLIDDIRPSSKRRRMNMNGTFTSGNSSKTGAHLLVKKKRVSRGQQGSQESGLTADGGTDCVIPCEDVNIENVLSEDSNDALPEDNIQIEDSVSRDLQSSLPSLRGPKHLRKKRQTKLTNFGLRSAVPENTSNTTDTMSLSSTTTGNVRSNTLIPQSASLSTSGCVPQSQSNFTSMMSSQSVAIPVASVKVRVKDKLLIVPVFEGEVCKTISWLANEASLRYYKLTGLQPILSLSTKDGAILTFDDPLSLVLSSNEEVEGNVENWDLPPVSVRYDQACKALNTVSYRNIRTILSMSEGSGKLSLQYLALKPSQILPVFRAIQCQNSLKELCLKANRLSDVGIEGLVSILPSLPNLTILDISCNNFSYVGIKTLSSFFSQSRKENELCALQNLTDLYLSHNLLGDGCCMDISTILSALPSLTRLDLSSCEFTAKLFQQNRVNLAQAIQKSSLTSLNFSHNAIGCLGVEQLLRCLDHCQLLSLDLSSTMVPNSPSHMFIHHVQNFLSQEKSALQSLKLSTCHLHSEETQQISRMVEMGSRLTSIDLSGNLKLGNEVLTGVLKSSKDMELEEFRMDGCGVMSPLSTEFIDSVLDKLMSQHPLKWLSFTCGKLDKTDSESLTQVWRERWGDLGIVEVTENFVKLRVCDM